MIHRVLERLAAAVVEKYGDNPEPELAAETMRAWYEVHQHELFSVCSNAAVECGATSEEFRSVKQAIGKMGLKLALHAWGSEAPAAPVQHPHNHVMPAAGLIVSGELRQLTYPNLEPEAAMSAWMMRTTVRPGAVRVMTFARGEAYSLSRRTFHSVQARVAETMTIFLMMPPHYSGNIHVNATTGAVMLKVKPLAAEALQRMRARSSAAGIRRVMRDTTLLRTEGAAVEI